ncbi:ferredoxin [Enterobacter sp. BIGb0383]|uniref:ferredoxin n=1 Tax=unclassified Enterobacter TaxID=2608935 RepID=UPI000FB13CCE|nr:MULTISPECIES: ferredoxin [unclassified Enterobacter]ROP61553.1 ferredoxin [Enterobacter sp. BIGb0383]ROS11714.1 ferredoxin [Enterobacter sp. BIGb0359]
MKYSITDTFFNETYDCDEGMLILDAAENHGLDYPYSGRSGGDLSSIALRLSGQVLDESGFLSPHAQAAGFFLTDSSFPLTDLVIASQDIFLLYDEYTLDPDKWFFPAQHGN